MMGNCRKSTLNDASGMDSCLPSRKSGGSKREDFKTISSMNALHPQSSGVVVKLFKMTEVKFPYQQRPHSGLSAGLALVHI
jgi:hypothetical protein